jgi:hypothetical protein
VIEVAAEARLHAVEAASRDAGTLWPELPKVLGIKPNHKWLAFGQLREAFNDVSLRRHRTGRNVQFNSEKDRDPIEPTDRRKPARRQLMVP